MLKSKILILLLIILFVFSGCTAVDQVPMLKSQNKPEKSILKEINQFLDLNELAGITEDVDIMVNTKDFPFTFIDHTCGYVGTSEEDEYREGIQNLFDTIETLKFKFLNRKITVNSPVSATVDYTEKSTYIRDEMLYKDVMQSRLTLVYVNNAWKMKVYELFSLDRKISNPPPQFE